MRRRRLLISLDLRLQRALLGQLLSLERTFRPGDVVVVEPKVGGLHMTNSVGLPGYDDRTIEAHLRVLLVERLIENGDMHHPNVGIHFARVTRRGRKWLLAHAEPQKASSAERLSRSDVAVRPQNEAARAVVRCAFSGTA